MIIVDSHLDLAWNALQWNRNIQHSVYTIRTEESNLSGAGRVGRTGTAFVLQSDEMKGENSLDHPTKIAPVERAFAVSGNEFSYSLLPHSFTVLRIPTR